MNSTRLFRGAILFAGLAITPMLAKALMPTPPIPSDYAIAWAPGTEGGDDNFECTQPGPDDCPK